MPRGLGTGPRTTTATCGRSRLIRTTGSKMPGSAGCRRAEQAHLGCPADHQFRRARGRRRRGEHPVPAQLQRRGQRLGEQSVVVDHHEPHSHRATPQSPDGCHMAAHVLTDRAASPPAPVFMPPASYTLVRRCAPPTGEKPPDCRNSCHSRATLAIRATAPPLSGINRRRGRHGAARSRSRRRRTPTARYSLSSGGAGLARSSHRGHEQPARRE